MVSESQGEAEKRQERKHLKDVKHNGFVAAQSTQSEHGCGGAKDRKTAWRSHSSNQRSCRTNSVEPHTLNLKQRNLFVETPNPIADAPRLRAKQGNWKGGCS